MSETTNRDSAVILDAGTDTKSAFGVPVEEGETIAKDTDHTPDTQESEQKVERETTEPEQEEEESTEEQETEEEEVDETSKELKELKKKASMSHKMVLDAIDSKYALLEAGTLSQSELKQWFQDHPEFNRVANKSKRLKEKHRAFMEGKEESVKPTVTSTPSEDSSDSEDDRPLTYAEYKKLQQQFEDRQLATGLLQEREQQAEEYAVKYNIKDDDYTMLKKSAEALYQAHDEWSFEQALVSAKNALYPTKNKPINAPSKGTIEVPTETDDDIDLEIGATISL